MNISYKLQELRDEISNRKHGQQIMLKCLNAYMDLTDKLFKILKNDIILPNPNGDEENTY